MTIKQCISVFIILAAITPAYANDPNFQNVNEQKLIAVLKSGAPLYDKTQACQKLAVFGSKKSVPALAGLLGDKALGDYARIALEPMKHPGVDEAFRSAAGKLKGRLLAGVITSIGVRRDAKAIATLKSLASDKNNTIARSALFALGRIASDESVAAVMQTLDKGRVELRTDAADAALAAARIMLDAKQTEASAKIYDTVGKSAVPAYVQTAAVYGALVARGVKGLPQLAQLLRSDDPAKVAVALRASNKLPGAEVSAKLAEELGKQPKFLTFLIKTLADRGDPGACKAVVDLAANKDPAVRIEALKALGKIGDATSAPVLLKSAGAEGPESAAALSALRSINGNGVDAAILKGMTNAKGDLKASLISVLSDRRYAPAAKAVLAEAASTNASVSRAACKAIGVLGTPGDIPAIINIMPADSAQAEASIVALAAKTSDPSKRVDPVLAALGSAKKGDKQAAMIRILGKIGGDKALDAVVKSDSKDAAVRALAGWPDAKAAAPLLEIVKSTGNKTHRILALRGYVRLLGLDPNTPVAEYAEVLELAKQSDTKKLVLSGIAGVANVDALKLVIPLLDDKAVQGEAALAAVAIAGATMGSDRPAVRSAMEKVLAVSKGKPVAREARRIIGQIDALGNCIAAWRVSGPYMKKGADYRVLFNIPFAPETPEAKGVVWRTLSAGTDPKRPPIVDLKKAIGGDQRVAYALTWIHSEKATDARLDMGSDDGIKAWLNGKLVHAKNAPRAAIPYTDKVQIKLKAGWNPLLLKITQNQIPWEFCVRITTRNGKGEPVSGVRTDHMHEGDWRLPAGATPALAPPAKIVKYAPAGKPVRIFDGKTFDGWEGNLKSFRIEDGAVVGGTLKAKIPRNEFLCTKKQYTNFELRLKVKLADGKGNAGIQFRTKQIPNHHEVSGYQADMGMNWWGCLYDESRRRKVLARADKAALAKVLKRDGWNEYVIRCGGPRIQLFINGLKTVDYTEQDPKIPATGIIGLQIHGGGPSESWYKDVEIVELKPADGK